MKVEVGVLGSLSQTVLVVSVNMVLNVHRNHKVYLGREEGGTGVRRWGEGEDYIPIATLLPPE